MTLYEERFALQPDDSPQHHWPVLKPLTSQRVLLLFLFSIGIIWTPSTFCKLLILSGHLVSDITPTTK
jgi:hypothetical protein